MIDAARQSHRRLTHTRSNGSLDKRSACEFDEQKRALSVKRIYSGVGADERSEFRIGQPEGAIATAGPSAGAAGASPVLPMDSPEVEDVQGEWSCQR